ncbi:cytochrome o ubiquinol oxidase subunit IV [Salinisphaera aquimarina]|uniref:Cytochrome bo(3) ubiquinol oxidase subunit 4 n=1 Tax=Salinisphaera aquimarina TaxID=2094031 RepID=A0ABV7ERF9_9GAMM
MSDHSSHSHSTTAGHAPTLSGYLTGFVAALVLTIVPFALVSLGWFSVPATLIVVAVAGAIQVVVHLRYFLHLDMSEEQRWNTISVAFSAVIMFVLVGGTIWLFYSLHYRM